MTALELMVLNLKNFSFDDLREMKIEIDKIIIGSSEIDYNILSTQAKSILKYEGIVPCVKFIKEQTGWGLLESKSYYDNHIKQ